MNAQAMWQVKQDGFDKSKIELNGSKFLLGNGYMGYRGTLDEFAREQLVSCVLAGVYDRVGKGWREPVNAPNGLLTRVYCNGQLLSVIGGGAAVQGHEQMLDIGRAVHERCTQFRLPDGNVIEVRSQRFVSLANVHLIGLKFAVKAQKKCKLVIETGIDAEVWDINGPHLAEACPEVKPDDILAMGAVTQEMRYVVGVAQWVEGNCGQAEVRKESRSIAQRYTVEAQAGATYELTKYVGVFSTVDGVKDPVASAAECCRAAGRQGYDQCLAAHEALWQVRWDESDVQIEGDEESQLALRYSIYHLLAIAPTHTDKVSIPARGLSGQVYKGAIFWDTEIFMMPFFTFAQPRLARNLLRYRYHTLDGARRKAKDLGFRGAYYAWESQDSGDDACTNFNVTDVFTKRPLRTYFRDKQVHISADVAHAVWRYYELTGDQTVLLEGGAEIILECARFFYSYAYFKKEKNRYEVLDVVGPDEYHERVNNNAFTSGMVKRTLDVAVATLELLETRYPAEYAKLIAKINYAEDVANIREMSRLLYVPRPDARQVIEQFDGYLRMEDCTLKELKSRIIEPNEYWGCHGLASQTQILKQADVVLMLHLFRDSYSREVKKANWDFYEPRTEHGSSLSPCVYALVAADVGDAQWGYKFFRKTAEIDLKGDAKQYLGLLYIGGTHPAANGGAWMAAILGFGGFNPRGEVMEIRPVFPEQWKGLKFKFHWRGQRYHAAISREQVTLSADAKNAAAGSFSVAGQAVECAAGQTKVISYK